MAAPESTSLLHIIESLTTIGANVVTMGAAVSVAISLSAVVYFQRRQTELQTVRYVADGLKIPYSDVLKDLLNQALFYADNHRFAEGLNPGDTVPPDYTEYVGRLISLFDLVLMNDERPETVAKIREVLSRHAVVTSKLMPLRLLGLIPMGKRIKSVLRSLR